MWLPTPLRHRNLQDKFYRYFLILCRRSFLGYWLDFGHQVLQIIITRSGKPTYHYKASSHDALVLKCFTHVSITYIKTSASHVHTVWCIFHYSLFLLFPINTDNANLFKLNFRNCWSYYWVVITLMYITQCILLPSLATHLEQLIRRVHMLPWYISVFT